MLDVLWMAMQEMPVLLLQEDEWQSLDIACLYPPRVERVWRQWGPYRILLHVIHPCDEAPMHPHPWPSAARILSGRCIMQMGQGDTLPGAPAMTVELSTGSTYEMLDPHGWHSVRPFSDPVTSIMVTGPPWGQRTLVGGANKHRLAPVRPKAALSPLHPKRAEEILDSFRRTRWPRTSWTHQT